MHEAEIPPELLQRIQDGRVAFLVGAGCSRSAGLPSWEELLKRLISEFEKRNLLNPGDPGQIKRWRQRAEDFPRIAEMLKSRSPQVYLDLMQEIFDPTTPTPRFVPAPYFALFRELRTRYILTTNFDKLLEDSLGSAWGTLTWQDEAEFPRYLRGSGKLIFHMHGRADRFGTLVHTLGEYNSLQGREGEQAREFLKRIFETNTILVLGYRLADPVIRWVHESLWASWKMRPDWYLLSPVPTEEQRRTEREIRDLRLLAYPFDPTGGLTHEIGLLHWFQALARQLGLPEPSAERASDYGTEWLDQGLVAVTRAFLDWQPAATEELCQRYYRGEPVRWSLVKAGFTARRAATAEALKLLEGEGLRAVLLTGAGGEGKSTILMQMALALLDRGHQVFYMADPEKDLIRLLRQSKGSIALLIDNADEIRNVAALLRYADQRPDPTCIVLAARPHEWKQTQRNLGDSARLLQTLRIPRLSESEAREISGHLVSSGTVRGLDVDTLTTRLLQDSNRFLLAAMLTATQGRALAAILADVVRKVAEWPRGDELLVALALVVALEAREHGGGRLWCSLRLFAEAMGISKQEVYRICGRLTGEVSLHPRGGYRIETRHPVIASTLFPILFKSEPPLLDEMEIHERLIRAAGRLSRDHVNPGERKLMTVLPLIYLREQQVPVARQLFGVSTEADPKDAPSWQAWARMEEELGNVGSLAEPNTARWLFKKATVADPQDTPSWQAWARMEGELRNVGSLTEPNTARWLFKKATEADPKNAPSWQAWARMEGELGNVGSLAEPNTARWLFKKATEADPKNAPSWQAWARMEGELGNIGSLDEPEPNTARWLFKKATEADPKHAPSWQAWALMEGELGHANTARWLFKKAIKADAKHAPVWQAWAVLERREGNIGNLSEPNTARWLFKKATEADPKDALSWQAWAEMELHRGSGEDAGLIVARGLVHCPEDLGLKSLERRLYMLDEHPLGAEIRRLLAEGQYDQAGRLLKEALFANPEDKVLLQLHREWRART